MTLFYLLLTFFSFIITFVLFSFQYVSSESHHEFPERLVYYVDCLHTTITLIVVRAAIDLLFLKTQKADEVLKKAIILPLLGFLSLPNEFVDWLWAADRLGDIGEFSQQRPLLIPPCGIMENKSQRNVKFSLKKKNIKVMCRRF